VVSTEYLVNKGDTHGVRQRWDVLGIIVIFAIVFVIAFIIVFVFPLDHLEATRLASLNRLSNAAVWRVTGDTSACRVVAGHVRRRGESVLAIAWLVSWGGKVVKDRGDVRW
jgi:hypothetical protein